MLNTAGHYTRDKIFNENIRISEKLMEILANYLDVHRSRSAVHSVGGTRILCPLS